MSWKSKIFAMIAVAALALAGCGPDYPACEKDDHCHDGEYCVNNLCQQCRDNGDCPEGQECTGGGCRDIPGYCKQTADCAQGQICRDSRCGPCLSDGDCATGTVCMDGLCGVAECETTDDCPAGLSCVGHRCRVDEGGTSQLGSGDCSLEPLYFEFDSSEIDDSMRNQIESNYDCWLKRGGRLTVEGHCDPRGTTEYNMALGERRARMAAKVLRHLGAEGSQLRVVSKGEEEASGGSESGWVKDRRVDFE